MKLRAMPLIGAFLFLFISGATAASVTPFDSARPVEIRNIPIKSSPAPLLIGLHSAGMSGDHFEGKAQLTAEARKAGWIYITPNGTVGSDGRRVWNAANSCCQHDGKPVNEASYLKSVIEKVNLIHPINYKEIYLVGTSNGAFMSYAFACNSGMVAGIVAIAGALDTDFKCKTNRNFKVLSIHGTADSVIKFNGGAHAGFTYTSAPATAALFATHNRCAPIQSAALRTLDFDPRLKGNETQVHTYEKCLAPVVQWDISGGKHSPTYPKNFAKLVISFLKNQE